MLEAVRELSPMIRGLATEAETGRRLPSELVAALREREFFGLAFPRALGGLELDPVTQLDIIEALGYEDGSTGWCVMIGCDTGYLTGWLADEVSTQLFGAATVGPTALVVAPGGQGQVEDGGYRLSGRWTFGSGREHCAHVGVGFLAVNLDGSMRMLGEGQPDWRIAVIPVDSTATIDTWTTTGLNGTGSHDFSVDGVFVPTERTFSLFEAPQRSEALYRHATFFISKLGAVPLGIARRAIDELATLAAGKVLMPSMTLLCDDVQLQLDVARATALVASARSWLREVTQEMWAVVQTGAAPSLDLRGRYRLAISHAGLSAKEAVEIVYAAAGGASVYRTSTLERCLRDVTTAAQHILVQRRNQPPYARAILGMEPLAPLV